MIAGSAEGLPSDQQFSNVWPPYRPNQHTEGAFLTWVMRLRKCVDAEGEYFEKTNEAKEIWQKVSVN